MCILFVFTDPEPRKGCYRSIIASNRDEFYKRPAKFAFKNDETKVIGGLDMEPERGGGMWLGVSYLSSPDFNFRFGALLNVTGEEKKSVSKSRGFIVCDYLAENVMTEAYIDNLKKVQHECNAFNFVAVEMGSASSKIFSNSNAPDCLRIFEGSQTLAFGNSTIDWPLAKVKAGKDVFENIISQFNDKPQEKKLCDNLLELLKMEKHHLPDPELERRIPDGYKPVSSIYVKYLKAGYGTRTHSIALVDYDWNVIFIEQSMNEPINPTNPTWNETTLYAHF